MFGFRASGAGDGFRLLDLVRCDSSREVLAGLSCFALLNVWRVKPSSPPKLSSLAGFLIVFQRKDVRF